MHCISYKQPSHDKLVWHSLVEQTERKDSFMLKICWFQETFNIPSSHTVNIDETSLRLLPLRPEGWLRTGEQASAITGNEKEATTVTLAMTMSPEVFTFLAQVIHKGKTSAVLPPRPQRKASYTASPRTVGSTLKASSTSLPSSMGAPTPKVSPVLMLRSHGSSCGIWRAFTPRKPRGRH